MIIFTNFLLLLGVLYWTFYTSFDEWECVGLPSRFIADQEKTCEELHVSLWACLTFSFLPSNRGTTYGIGQYQQRLQRREKKEKVERRGGDQKKGTRPLTWVTDKILHSYTYDTSEVCLKKVKMKTYSSTKKKRLFSAALFPTVDFGPPTFNGDSYQTKHQLTNLKRERYNSGFGDNPNTSYLDIVGWQAVLRAFETERERETEGKKTAFEKPLCVGGVGRTHRGFLTPPIVPTSL